MPSESPEAHCYRRCSPALLTSAVRLLPTCGTWAARAKGLFGQPERGYRKHLSLSQVLLVLGKTARGQPLCPSPPEAPFSPCVSRHVIHSTPPLWDLLCPQLTVLGCSLLRVRGLPKPIRSPLIGYHLLPSSPRLPNLLAQNLHFLVCIGGTVLGLPGPCSA